MKKRVYCVLVILLLASLISGGYAKAAPEPYRIGVMFSQTGYMAPLAIPALELVIAVANDINRKGGVNGHPIELVIYDEESSETTGVLVAKRLISVDNALAIIGPHTTGTNLAMRSVVNELEIPHYSCCGSTIYDKPLMPWSFRLIQGGSAPIRPLLIHLQKLGVKKVGCMIQGAGFGEEGWDLIETFAPEYGMEIVIKETYDPRGTMFAPQLTKIKAKDPEAVLFWGAEMAGGLAIKQAREMGMRQPFGTCVPLAMPHILGSVGEYYTAKWGTTLITQCTFAEVAPDLPKDEIVRLIVEERKALVPHLKLLIGPHNAAADSLEVVVDALKRSMPSRDPAKVKEARAQLRDALETTKDLETSMGTITLSPTNHNYGIAKTALAEYREGRLHAVELFYIPKD